MVAYQAESHLVRGVAPHCRRAEDEGRTLVQAALGSSADITVDAVKRVLRVVLAPMSSPHRTRAHRSTGGVARFPDRGRACHRLPITESPLRWRRTT
jgi:hypothetical protein